MSSNRLFYDTCQAKQQIFESVQPGNYMLGMPFSNCAPCVSNDPHNRLQATQPTKSQELIDVDSELMNITKPSTKCSSKKWPNGSTCLNYDHSQANVVPPSPDQIDGEEDCFAKTDDTRLNNPPCNLRGTGWNRWEWLCMNPQDKVELPFAAGTCNRILVKDNHRPCIPTPIDPQPLLPRGGELPCEMITPVCSNPTEPASVYWKGCNV